MTCVGWSKLDLVAVLQSRDPQPVHLALRQTPQIQPWAIQRGLLRTYRTIVCAQPPIPLQNDNNPAHSPKGPINSIDFWQVYQHKL